MTEIDAEATARVIAEAAAKKRKPCYLGAPAIYRLEQACLSLNDAFGGFHCFLVGSALDRQDWRDVDVRYILSDSDFAALFPGVADLSFASWEFDPRWQWLTISISERLSKLTGLPIDFQFQPQTFANERHKKPRQALGMRYAKVQP